MTGETNVTAGKPTKYFIDFENTHGAGLKGVDKLGEDDEVAIIYSQAAETFHIEHAIDIMNSKARILFVEADAGTRNAADFQLIVALYADMDEAYEYAIISGDGGFDAAIKMGERMGKPTVRRLANIAGDEAETDKPKSRRSRRSRSDRKAKGDAAEGAAPADAEAPQAETAAATPESEAAEQEKPAAASQDAKPEVQAESHAGEQADAPSQEQSNQQAESESRTHAKATKQTDAAAHTQAAKKAEGAPQPQAVELGETADAQAANQTETKKRKSRRRSSKRVSTRKETDDAYAKAAEAMRLASENAAAKPVAPEADGGEAANQSEPTADEAAAQPKAPADEPAAHPETAAEGSAQPEKVADDPAAQPEAPASDAADNSADDLAARVNALLQENDVQLTDKQLATVVDALEGPDGRQGFYRRIIKIERQQNGRALYRLVRDHYAALTKLIG